MLATYRALSLMLTYPTPELARVFPEAVAAARQENLLPAAIAGELD